MYLESGVLNEVLVYINFALRYREEVLIFKSAVHNLHALKEFISVIVDVHTMNRFVEKLYGFAPAAHIEVTAILETHLDSFLALDGEQNFIL